MHYDDRVICFLDFLGFRAHIGGTVDAQGIDITDEIQRIADAIAQLRELSGADQNSSPFSTVVTQFSDSVVISFASDEESGVHYALLSILHIQMALLKHKILCRGAITRGKLVHSPTALFGPAMNRAYDLETKTSVFPRVILDDTVLLTGGVAHARHHDANEEKESIMKLLARDSDGLLFVDYITRAQGELDDPDYGYPEYLDWLGSIARSGVSNPDLSVAAKYRWLAQKWNVHLVEVQRYASTHLEDHDLADAYASLELVQLP